jgi:hypothetical protein
MNIDDHTHLTLHSLSLVVVLIKHTMVSERFSRVIYILRDAEMVLAGCNVPLFRLALRLYLLLMTWHIHCIGRRTIVSPCFLVLFSDAHQRTLQIVEDRSGARLFWLLFNVPDRLRLPR